MSIKGYVCFYFLRFEYIYVKFKSFNQNIGNIFFNDIILVNEQYLIDYVKNKECQISKDILYYKLICE